MPLANHAAGCPGQRTVGYSNVRSSESTCGPVSQRYRFFTVQALGPREKLLGSYGEGLTVRTIVEPTTVLTVLHLPSLESL